MEVSASEAEPKRAALTRMLLTTIPPSSETKMQVTMTAVSLQLLLLLLVVPSMCFAVLKP